jgi:hypothetical protein
MGAYDLSKVLNDAITYSYGCVAVAVWVIDQEDGFLKLHKNGFMSDPNYEKKQLLDRVLEAEIHRPVPPLTAGVCLPGCLWAESRSVESFHRKTQKAKIPNKNVMWKNLNSLITDPDTHTTKNLELLHEAGLGRAAGFPFTVNGYEGLVIFFARVTADLNKLCSKDNVLFLTSKTTLIGAYVSIMPHYEARMASRKRVNENTWNVFTKAIRPKPSKDAQLLTSVKKKDIESEKLEISFYNKENISQQATRWLKKFRGAKQQVMPPMIFTEAMLSGIGAFSGLFILGLTNSFLNSVSDGKYGFTLAPFGALMTLQYNLTQAPAAQPYNIILGEIVSMSIALLSYYVLVDSVPSWFLSAFAPGLAIGVMAKLGFTHPPAGAQAVLFSQKKYNFVSFIIVLFACFISLIPAILINNLSRKRHYPTFWFNGKILTFINSSITNYKGKKVLIQEKVVVCVDKKNPKSATFNRKKKRKF